MFFHIKLEKTIVLEPRHFGKKMREVLHERLKHEVRDGSGRAGGGGARRVHVSSLRRALAPARTE